MGDVVATLNAPRSVHGLYVDLCEWTDTGIPKAQVCLLLWFPKYRLAGSVPGPCMMSALCPLQPCLELPLSLCRPPCLPLHMGPLPT